MRYKKKPIIVEAVEYDGNFRCLDIFPLSEVKDFILRKNIKGEQELYIPTSEGNMLCNIGDYVIKEPFDKVRKYYPCKPDIFEKTYEKVDEDPKNIWGESIKDTNDFFKKITKNAGQRD